MIDKWVITISGFTQDLDEETGIELLWKKIRGYACHDTCVSLPLEWNTDWEALAKFIHRNSTEKPEIYIIAYSWGCGDGFVQLSRYLWKKGYNVKHAVLCDPVYKDKWWFMSWLAVTEIKKIKVYPNVENVSWFRQKENMPKGHDLKIMGSETVVEDAIYLKYTHSDIDNAPEFHNKVKEVLSGYLEFHGEDHEAQD